MEKEVEEEIVDEDNYLCTKGAIEEIETEADLRLLSGDSSAERFYYAASSLRKEL